jgi:Protein of unknown function (DUF3300)
MTTQALRTPGRQTRAAATAWHLVLLGLLMLFALLPAARAQDSFSNEELDQMLAPIALYPDSLLSQILMASTYPADVAEAAEWSRQHPDTKGDAAVQQVQNRDWEPSVQSLVAFPQVMAMMRAKPDDVQRIGDAFLEDPARVMDRVQYLRLKAQQAGNLKTNEQQRVVVQTEAAKQVIVIEPAQPQVVYVPVYQPTVVYGSWWYPSYPPYYWAPPPYYYPPSSGAFVAGVFWGAAVVGISNSLWGGFNWGRNDVNINVNRYNNINVNNKITNVNNNTFVHNAEHRKDVPYRGTKSQEKYGKQQSPGAKDREAYRGKDGREEDRARASQTLKDRGADPAAGREKLQAADREKAAAATRDKAQTRDVPGTGNRDKAAPATREADRTPDRANDRTANAGADRAADRSASSGARDTAFTGANDSAGSKANADRGRTSRESMNSRPSGGGNAKPAARPAPAPKAAPKPAARPSPGGKAGGGLKQR